MDASDQEELDLLAEEEALLKKRKELQGTSAPLASASPDATAIPASEQPKPEGEPGVWMHPDLSTVESSAKSMLAPIANFLPDIGQNIAGITHIPELIKRLIPTSMSDFGNKMETLTSVPERLIGGAIDRYGDDPSKLPEDLIGEFAKRPFTSLATTSMVPGLQAAEPLGMMRKAGGVVGRLLPTEKAGAGLKSMVAFETGQSPGELSTIARVAREGGASDQAYLQGLHKKVVPETLGQDVEKSVNGFIKTLDSGHEKTLADYVQNNIRSATPDPASPHFRTISVLRDAVNGTITPLAFWNDKIAPALQNLKQMASQMYRDNMAKVPDLPVELDSMKQGAQSKLEKYKIFPSVSASPESQIQQKHLGLMQKLGIKTEGIIPLETGAGEVAQVGIDFSKSRLSDVPSGVRKQIEDLYKDIFAREGDSVHSLDLFKQQMDEKYRPIIARMKSPTGRAVLSEMLQSIREGISTVTKDIPEYGIAQKSWADLKILEEALKTDLSFGASSIETPYKKILGIVDHPENNIRTSLTQEIKKGMRPGEDLEHYLEVLKTQDGMSDIFKGKKPVSDIIKQGEYSASDLNEVTRVAEMLMPKQDFINLMQEYGNKENVARNILNQAKGVYTGTWADKGKSVSQIADLLNNPSEDRISQTVLNAIKADNPNIAEKFAGLNAHTILGRTYIARRLMLGLALGIPIYTSNPIMFPALLTMSPRGVATLIRGGVKAQKMIESMASYATPQMVQSLAVARRLNMQDRDSSVVSSRAVPGYEVRRRLLGK